MATTREMLEKAAKGGMPVPDSVLADYYDTLQLTDELADAAFTAKYGGEDWAEGHSPAKEPTLPGLDAVIAAIGLADDDEDLDGARSARQKFIEDYPKKWKDWKEDIEKNPKWGKLGWKTVRKAWQDATLDAMGEKIASDRAKAVDDGSVASFITTTLFPRTTEHLRNNGDYTAKDILLDIAENAAMSVPGAGWLSLPGKGMRAAGVLSRLPGVGRAARAVASVPGRVSARQAELARTLSGSTIGNTAKYLGGMSRNILGNAVVPVGMEAADAALYGDTDGMDQRADFSWADAAMGTAVNQMANRGLYRLMATPSAALSGEVGRGQGGGAAGMIRNALQHVGEPMDLPGAEFAGNVRVRANGTPVRQQGMMTPGEYRAARLGSMEAESAITPAEAEHAALQSEILDAIDRGEIVPRAEREVVKDARKHRVTQNWKDADHVERLDKQLDALYGMRSDIENEVAATGVPMDDKLDELSARIQELQSEKSRLGRQMTADRSGAAADEVFDIKELVDRQSREDFVDIDPEAVLKELSGPDSRKYLNYAIWHGKGPGTATRTERVLNDATQMLPSYAINKAGRDEMTKQAFGAFPAIGEAISKDRKETSEAPGSRRASEELSAVLSGSPDLTEEDRAFLKAIAEKPSRVKTGYVSGTDPDGTKFRLWLLARGNDLIRGTSAYRPAFTVEQ